MPSKGKKKAVKPSVQAQLAAMMDMNDDDDMGRLIRATSSWDDSDSNDKAPVCPRLQGFLESPHGAEVAQLLGTSLPPTPAMPTPSAHSQSLVEREILSQAGDSRKQAASQSPTSSTTTTPLSYTTMEEYNPADHSRLVTPTPVVPNVDKDRFFSQMEVMAASFDTPTSNFTMFFNIVLRFLTSVASKPKLVNAKLGGQYLEFSIGESIELATPIAKRTQEITPKAQPAPLPKVERPPPKKARTAHPPPPPSHPPPPDKSAPAKADSAPVTLSKRPDPKDAPPISVKQRAPACCVAHTVHGPNRQGIKLTPPVGSSIRTSHFTSDILGDINHRIMADLKTRDLTIKTTHEIDRGIFLTTTRVPSSAEIVFVLKHVRRHFPHPNGPPIEQAPITSTSYLKVVDVPLIPAPSKTWMKTQREAFSKALTISLVGSKLATHIKHVVRFMHTSPKADSCIAWIDIHDFVSGKTAQDFITKFISIGGVNCQIRGVHPHSGSVQCTRCLKWGHHFKVCRSKGVHCSFCGGPHSGANHATITARSKIAVPAQCVNCVKARKAGRNHPAMDKSCLFWTHRFDPTWIKEQFKWAKTYA